MNPTRRALLLGAGLALAGCAGDPTVAAPEGARTRVQEPEEPKQDEALAKAASLVGCVRGFAQRSGAGAWREAAVAQCEDQLARCNSINPFGEPEPVFDPAAAKAKDLADAIRKASAGLAKLAAGAPDPSMTLLFLSMAASTLALGDASALPGEGGSPSHVAKLGDPRTTALGHVWALLYGLEAAVGRLDRKDPLREPIQARMVTARELRNTLRDAGPTPSQPASFQLPNELSSPDEIRAAWAALEENVLESLVLYAVESPEPQLWAQQVTAVHAAGGRVPRWPGWD